MNLFKKLNINLKKLVGTEKNIPIPRTGRKIQTSVKSPSKYKVVQENTSGECLNIRSEAIGSLEWQVISKKTGEEISTDHWLSKLIKKPNPFLNSRQIFKNITWNLDVDGDCLIYCPKNLSRYPSFMHVLPNPNTSIIFNQNGNKEYHFKDGINTKVYKEDEIIHITKVRPGFTLNSNYNGLGLADQCMNAIIADYEMVEFIRRFYQNDGSPPLSLRIPAGASKEQYDQWVQQYNLNNPANPIKILIEGDMELKPIASAGQGSSSPTALNSYHTIIKKTIAATYAVPYLWLDEAPQYTHATAVTEERIFRKDTIEPLALEIETELNQFFSQFDNTVEIKHVPYLPQDESISADVLSKNESAYANAYINNVITLNEYREKINLDKIKDGDKYKNELEPPEQPEHQNQSQPSEKSEKQLKVKSFRTEDISEEELKKYWLKYNQKQLENEEELLNRFKSLFKELEDIILSNIYNKDSKAIINKKPQVKNLFTLKEFVELVKKHISPKLSDNFDSLMSLSAEEIGIEWSDIKSDFDKIINNNINDSVNKIKTSGKTVKKELTGVLQKLKNKPVDEIADSISDHFEDYTNKNAYKSQRIAQTTSTFVTNRSQKTVWKEFDIKYEWLTQRDNKVRDSHERMDGTTVNESGYFEIEKDSGETLNTEHPGNSEDASEDVNCRCVLRPEL